MTLRVLVVDDEALARHQLARLLEQDPRVGSIVTAADAIETLQKVEHEPVDAVLLDISLPGLSGMDLARVLLRFREPPAIAFVTGQEQHAVAAFELGALDYLLKPIRSERLAEAIRRIVMAREPALRLVDEAIAVGNGRTITYVNRSDVRWVQAHGDYARIHTERASHLVRIPLTTLQERWADAGFLRIHRSYLVAVEHVRHLHNDCGRVSLRVGSDLLPVSRRHARDLKGALTGRPPLTGAETTRPPWTGDHSPHDRPRWAAEPEPTGDRSRLCSTP